MKKHIRYPKIGQFRNVVSDIIRQATYVETKEDGEVVTDHSLPKPKLVFEGTVKLHGTNAAVCYNDFDGFWIQSRKRIITVEKDNAGFAFFASAREERFMKMINHIAKYSNINLLTHTITIFGEWAGQGIQKGVGISELEKAFYIFSIKISPITDDGLESAYWVDYHALCDEEFMIYSVDKFKTYWIEIDFNRPDLSQGTLSEITEDVEGQCPISKALGINGVGEGVVWTCKHKDVVYRFKVKGEKHSATKVKTLAKVDTEKLNSIHEFVDYAVTTNRFNQAVENVFGENDLDVKKMGDFLRWFINDIASEEMDTMIENSLEPKDVNKYLSTKAREMFFIAYNKV